MFYHFTFPFHIIGIAIARELKYNYVFQLEFIEIDSAKNSINPTFHGVHGNGIMTKFDFGELYSLDHETQPYNWDRDGVLFNEPRLGRRFSLAAVVQVPSIYVGSTSPNKAESITRNIMTNIENITTPLVCYTCHMELFCGITDRIKILAELFDHSRSLVEKGM